MKIAAAYIFAFLGIIHIAPAQGQRGRGYSYNRPKNPLNLPTTAKPLTQADVIETSSPSTSRPSRPRPQGYGSGRPPPGAPAFTYPPFSSSSSQQDDAGPGSTVAEAPTEAPMTSAGYPAPAVPQPALPSGPDDVPAVNDMDNQLDPMLPDTASVMAMMAAGTSYDMMTMGDYSAIPGVPDKDYPILSEIPKTSFSCKQQKLPGYYADVDARCQVFHVCANNLTYDFLCPNGTIFHQEYLVCVWWNQFDCSMAPELYSINAGIYDYSIKGSVFGSIQPPYPDSGKPSGTGFTLPPSSGKPDEPADSYSPGRPSGEKPSSSYGAPDDDQQYHATNHIKPSNQYLPSRTGKLKGIIKK